MNLIKISFIVSAVLISTCSFAQTSNEDDLDKLLNEPDAKKEYVRNAFKSTRVINSQSMEMLGEGVLDSRILHRFGMVKDGWREFFGLDQASMRIGFDYGVSKNFMLGIGRSTFNKEVDGFVKYRIAHQHKGLKPIPFSLLWVSGMTMNTTKPTDAVMKTFSNRLGFFNQFIIGRKFNEKFAAQLSPTFVHRNIVNLPTDKNDMVAIGIGTRLKLSNRMALILDAHPIIYGATKNTNQMPLSIGVDIETGGHVFQLHFSNSRGMNEKAFIAETTQQWQKGEFNFGFNLSRVFTVKKNTSTSW